MPGLYLILDRKGSKGEKAGRKPGSVHQPEGRWVIIYLGLALPTASSGSESWDWAIWPAFVPSPCS